MRGGDCSRTGERMDGGCGCFARALPGCVEAGLRQRGIGVKFGAVADPDCLAFILFEDFGERQFNFPGAQNSVLHLLQLTRRDNQASSVSGSTIQHVGTPMSKYSPMRLRMRGFVSSGERISMHRRGAVTII